MEADLLSGEKVLAEKKIHREVDSLDDFEHLDDIKGELASAPRVLDEVSVASTVLSPSLIDTTAPINDDTSDTVNNQTKHIEQPFTLPKMDSNLMDDFIQSENDNLFRKKEDEVLGNKQEEIFNGLTNATQTLLDYERNFMHEPKIIQPSLNDLADKFTDSDPDLDDDHMYDDENKAKFASADDLLRADSPTATIPVEQFKDVINEADTDDLFEDDLIEPTKSSKAVEQHSLPPPASVLVPADKGITIQEFVIEGITVDQFLSKNEPVKEFIPEDDDTPESHSPVNAPAPVEVSKVSPLVTKPEVGIMQAEEMFVKMGLDTWFNPERLHPTVESLIYWRDPKKSGAVFGSILVVLLSLAYFSLISVTAYLSLLVLTAAISFRIYKTVMQAVQKTSDGHPFKEILELDLTLPQDKVKDVTELVVTHVNGGINEFRRLFLVEDFIDSIKFGICLWCLTYLGAWFNGMTLIIIGFVALFTLPKVYETNKTQIDANLDIVRTKLAEITSKVKAAIPIGKKSEDKKD